MGMLDLGLNCPLGHFTSTLGPFESVFGFQRCWFNAKWGTLVAEGGSRPELPFATFHFGTGTFHFHFSSPLSGFRDISLT